MTTIDPGSRPLTLLRRTIVTLIIVAFGLAAIGGIIVLLGAELGDTALRVLGTTATVGAFSIAVLCCAALLSRPLRAVGVVGSIIAVLGAGLAVWQIWYDGEYGAAWENLMKVTWTAIAATVALSLASLLLLLADRRRSAVRVGLAVTLVLMAVVLGMIVWLIWAADTVDDQIFPRVLGVSSILAALGAVVVPVLSLLMPDVRRAGLSRATVDRIEAEAQRRGVTPDELVVGLLPAADGVLAAPPAQHGS
ncbi:hypothetical protein GCM10022240_09950 [Microbacterium kribbense]|uniref:Uncharacterized protein n=1 Tax=Microbacterium kribbense TaxID=433645 RepID=A0ABP7G8U2_9MICO